MLKTTETPLENKVYSTEKTLFIKTKRKMVAVRTYYFTDYEELKKSIKYCISNKLKFSILIKVDKILLKIFVKGKDPTEISNILDGTEFSTTLLSKKRVTGYEAEFNLLELFLVSIIEAKKEWGFFKNALNEELYVSVINGSTPLLLEKIIQKIRHNLSYSQVLISFYPIEKGSFSVNTIIIIKAKPNEKVIFLSLIKKIQNTINSLEEKTVRKKPYFYVARKYKNWVGALCVGYEKRGHEKFEQEPFFNALKQIFSYYEKELKNKQEEIQEDSIYYPPHVDKMYVLPKDEKKKSIINDEIPIPKTTNNRNIRSVQKVQQTMSEKTKNQIKNMVISRGFNLLNINYPSEALFIISKNNIKFAIYYEKELTKHRLDELVSDFINLKNYFPRLRALIVSNKIEKGEYLKESLPDIELIKLEDLN